MVAELSIMEKDSEKILNELKKIKKDIRELKSYLDEDNFATQEEILQYKEAVKEFEKGETISLEELKQELGHEY